MNTENKTEQTEQNELHFACEDCPYNYFTDCRSIWKEGADCKRKDEFMGIEDF